MELSIKKWGNSAAIQMPKTFLRALDVVENDTLNATLSKGKIILEPTQQHYSLDKLLEDYDPSHHHRELIPDEPIGQEIW